MLKATCRRRDMTLALRLWTFAAVAGQAQHDGEKSSSWALVAAEHPSAQKTADLLLAERSGQPGRGDMKFLSPALWMNSTVRPLTLATENSSQFILRPYHVNVSFLCLDLRIQLLASQFQDRKPE